MHAFRAAIEARDIDAAIVLLHEDVEFRSPVVFRPYRGRAAVGPILHGVIRVFQDFRYVREIGGANEHLLVFRANVAGREIEGCDILTCDETGAVTELVVMVRPLSGLLAVAEEMQKLLAPGSAGS